MTAGPFPMLYDRDSATTDRVDLVVVEMHGDERIVRQYALHPDQAVTLGLSLAARGWRARGPAVIP